MPKPEQGTLTIDQPEPHHFGDRITFTATFEAKPGLHFWVENLLFQDDEMVVGEVHAANSGDEFSLGPTTRYQGGASDGRATLYTQKKQGKAVYATLEYHVEP